MLVIIASTRFAFVKYNLSPLPKITSITKMKSSHTQSMKILLSEIMDQKKLTIRQVSILTGVPRSTVADIMSDRASPRLDTLEQLAKGLKVRITDLYESEYK